ncbi:hypothetical protein WICMUC_001874 [Wickerhamomyces mucosus]|uniref:Exocyst complex component Sec6 n=1 Tax=Wickerhamomyces mucosus TaxID=1378264 RepID=A0A9P8TFQ5_9ASCO|nr:hypothetical protein WICMUC_001874 [Wickerhamomyces mucosus]
MSLLNGSLTPAKVSNMSPALISLSQFLKTEDDLDKIITLKEQLIKEKSTLEVLLKNHTRSILERTLKDINSLSICQGDVKDLKENISKINKVSEHSFGSIKRFDLIDRITKVHEIFDQSTSLYEKISTFNDDLQEVDQLIESIDLDSIDELSELPLLLPIHYKLTKLRDFQEQILELSKFANEDSKFITKKLISKIYTTITKFDRVLEAIVGLLVEMCKQGNNSLIIRFSKLIEIEENHDIKIELLKNVLLKENKENNYIIFQQIINGNIPDRVSSRNYKPFFLEKLGLAVEDMFQACWELYNEQGNVFNVLGNLDWIYQDLKTVQDDLSTLMPQEWGIFKFYYALYFKNLQILIKKLIDKEPETLIILEILELDEKNQKIMKEDFQLNKTEIKSIFTEEEKAKLLDDYLNLIIMKMNEWMLNLNKTEIDVFIRRIQPPEQDSENLYALEGNKICFQMFTQQCDVAAGSGQGKILDGVVSEFSRHLLKRQENWSQLIKNEVIKLLKSHSSVTKEDAQNKECDEVAPGLIEYLIALANDQMRGADYSEAISNKYGGYVSKKYSVTIHANLEKVIDGYANLAKQCCDAIIVIIFDDLKEPFGKILHKSWINSNFVQQIIETLNEYVLDVKHSLNEYLFEILIEEILEEVILRYLTGLNDMNKVNVKDKEFLKIQTQIQIDFERIFKFFKTFNVDNLKIEHNFKILEILFELTNLEEYSELNSKDFNEALQDIAHNMFIDFNDHNSLAFIKLILIKFKKLKNIQNINWLAFEQMQNESEGPSSFLSRYQVTYKFK